MTNFIIAPTLTMGMKAPFEGILIATTWPLNSGLAKLKVSNDSALPHHVWVVKSEEHNTDHLNKILTAVYDLPGDFTIKEVSL